MNGTLPIIELPPEANLRMEQLGSKYKFWLDHQGRRGLFKAARVGTGEDWAEVAAAFVAKAIGLPHAECDLAVFQGRPGVISWSLLGKHDELLHGNEMLARLHGPYPHTDEARHVPQHTVRRCLYVCERIGLPPGFIPPPEVTRGVHLFVGYLMFDALIGNTDRHDQNWAWIFQGDLAVKGQYPLCLSPTYDHGSSLGRNLTDERRSEKLACADPRFDVGAYAAAARSCMYIKETDPKPALVREAFGYAQLLRPKAAGSWTKQLHSIDFGRLTSEFARIPESRASPVAIEFALRMIQETRMHLLQTIP